MKISQRLQQFINMTIDEQNAAVRIKESAQLQEFKKQALGRISPQIAQMTKLQNQRAKIAAKLDAIESALVKKGYSLDGRYRSKSVCGFDFKKLGFDAPKAEAISSRKVFAELLAADEVQGQKLLKKLGINF